MIIDAPRRNTGPGTSQNEGVETTANIVDKGEQGNFIHTNTCAESEVNLATDMS